MFRPPRSEVPVHLNEAPLAEDRRAAKLGIDCVFQLRRSLLGGVRAFSQDIEHLLAEVVADPVTSKNQSVAYVDMEETQRTRPHRGRIHDGCNVAEVKEPACSQDDHE